MMSDKTWAGDVHKVTVIGAGTMGRQIAALVANSGRPVILHDALPAAMDVAMDRLREELETIPTAPRYAHHQFRLAPPANRQQLLNRITIERDLATAVSGADFIIEAVREDLETKRGLFAEVSRLNSTAIISTNSSSIPSGLIASAAEDPGRVMNTHFFAPIWQRAMVELMTCGQTRPEVMERAAAFTRSLGIVVASVSGESKGFIINRIWRAVKRESLRVVDEGHASPEDVDRLWMIFFGTPMGPFGIMDMVGLDVVADIETSYQLVATDPMDKPSPALHEKVARGELGEKSGKGFYSHPDPEYLQPGWLTEGE